jgi:hypothetical protein
MEKRKAEDGEAGPEAAAKRARVEPANGGGTAAAAAATPAAGTAAPKKLGIDLGKLQKAKLALQKQKELAEKLKKAGITASLEGRRQGLCLRGILERAPCLPVSTSCMLTLLPSLVQLGKPGAAAAAVRLPAAGLSATAAAAVAAGVVPASLIAAGLAPAAPKPVTKLPPPLILDDEGREIDPLTGKPIERQAEQQAQQQQRLEQQRKAAEDAEK